MAKIRNFELTERSDVPKGRNGKHKPITTHILADLEGLDRNKALKIPLAELSDTKGNIRSALSRASRKVGRGLGTAADDAFRYVWNLPYAALPKQKSRLKA